MISFLLLPAIFESSDLRPEETEFFETHIRPVLVDHCYGCHSKDSGKSRGGLRLDTKIDLLAGGATGPAILPGDPDASLLIQAIRWEDEDYSMPPRRKLPEATIRYFEEWVRMGAPDPRVPTDVAAGEEHVDLSRGFDPKVLEHHWSFQPITDPPPPHVQDEMWPAGAIDQFILAELETAGVAPNPDADLRTRARRASLDLTGLPANPERLDALVSDQNPSAFGEYVDELLAAPAHAEHWGRHWLDVARYAESSGRENDVAYGNAWRYRDWVIDAFDQDMPFDEFITKQLAGDLLPSQNATERANNIVATGYLAIGVKGHNTRSRREFQADLIDEQIDVFSQGILGVTVACARCHDHKYDPIPQADYYAVKGIFESTDTLYGTMAGPGNRMPADLVLLPASAEISGGADLPPALRSFLERSLERSEANVERLTERLAVEGRERVNPAQIRNNRQNAENVQAVLDRYDDQGQLRASERKAMGVEDRRVPIHSRFLARGELDEPRQLVKRGVPSMLAGSALPKIDPDQSGRLELAGWIVGEENTLTARVWANRVWLHLMGRPLVETPDNFGVSGMAPSHPDLLDALATRLVELDWNTDALIREIVLSRAWGLSNHHQPNAYAEDPENILYWRSTPRRLPAESIRDSMLMASGELITSRPEGSPLSFAPGSARLAQLQTAISGPDHHRSVYLPSLRGTPPEFLAVFDAADPSFVTGARDETNVPTQALQLLNDDFVVGRSDALAQQILRTSRNEQEQIREVFRRTLGREPTPGEQRSSAAFMRDVSRLHDQDSAFESLQSTDQRQRPRVGRRSSSQLEELIDRSMREAGIPPEQSDRVRELLEADELPKMIQRQLDRLRRQGISREDQRFPDRLRRLLDAREGLAGLSSLSSSAEFRSQVAGPLDARTAAWSALAQALFASADFLYRP
ncbi:MAG: hypothetical protein CMJ28_06615 [Phycisphaerae bacterium]|nr:hypothetical protein [Phycisphaerae bacterium]